MVDAHLSLVYLTVRNPVLLYETPGVAGLEETTKERAQVLKSVDLALRVMESLRDVNSERGVTELAREFGVSKATVYRTLTTLERRGYVSQNPASGRYRLGLTLRRFSQVALDQVDLPAEARPYMEGLRDKTGEAIHLAVLDADCALYISKAEGLRPVQVVSSIGERCPAHCVSTGKVLLGFADEAYVDGLIFKGLTRYNERTYATSGPLKEELKKVRESGCAINRGEWREEVSGVAAPITTGDSEVVASMGVCAPSFRLDDETLTTIKPLVVEAAKGLSMQLGCIAEDYPRGTTVQYWSRKMSSPLSGRGQLNEREV
jgi:IclR family transcriptional regulator, KDG regulon repressor